MTSFEKNMNRRSMDLGSSCRNCHKRIIRRNTIARFRTVLDDVNEKGFCSTACQETYFSNKVKMQNLGVGVGVISRKNPSPIPSKRSSSGPMKRLSSRAPPLKRSIPAPPPPVVSKVEFKREMERVVTTMRKEHADNREKLLSGFKEILVEVTKSQKTEVELVRKQNEAMKQKNDEISFKMVELKKNFSTELGKINSRLEKIENMYNQELKGKDVELDNIRSSYEEYQVKILNNFKDLLE